MEHVFDKVLRELNSRERGQTDCCWEENIPSDLWDSYFVGKYKEVDSDLDIDQHRWYETSITVVELYGRYLGIRHVSNIYSESTDIEDICADVYFFEMEQVPSVTYREIK